MTDHLRVVRLGEPSADVDMAIADDREQASELGLGYTYIAAAPDEEIAEAVRDATVVLNSGFRMARRVIEAMPEGGLIQCNGTGYDPIDVAAATERGIAVNNLAIYSAEDVADHTIGLIIVCTRKILLLSNTLKRSRWCRDLLSPMPRLRGLTLGIVGIGNIGSRVAQRAQAFGFQIIAADPYVQPEAIIRYGAEMESLDVLLARSDIISCHTPLTAETYHLIGRLELEAMKPGVIFINTSRGPVVDEQALIQALQTGHVGAAGLDVFETEPVKRDNPLLAMENVVVTPHCGAFSDTSIANRRTMTWDQVRRFLRGEWLPTIVNPDVRGRLRMAAAPGPRSPA